MTKHSNIDLNKPIVFKFIRGFNRNLAGKGTKIKDDYEQFFNLSSGFFYIAGVDGYFRIINPAFSKILGYDQTYLLSNPILDFIHPEDLDATKKATEKLMQGVASVYVENRYRTKNNDYRLLTWSISVDRGSGHIFAIARDITDERHYQNYLNQIYKILKSEVIIAITDVNGDITEVNDKFCDISGYSEAELIGYNHRLIDSGKNSSAFLKGIWDVISSGKVWSGKIENRAKNGEFYYVKTIITPIFDPQGAITHYFSTCFVITQYSHRKEALRKTNDILNQVGSIAKVGGWELEIATGKLTCTDETFNILEVQKSANQQLSLPEGLALFVDDHKLIIENAVTQAIKFGEAYALELKVRTLKGRVFWVYTNGKANYKEGKIISLFGTIQDIDLRKNAELQIDADRVKSIQNAKLASLGELAAGIAHEINNPLAVIDGATQLMQSCKNNSDKFNAYIKYIKKSCARITRIVNSLKKFSRSNNESCFAWFSLRHIVEEALILTETNVKRHKTHVTLDCRSSGFIWCDEIEIEQAVVNIINNAVDAVKSLDIRWIKISISNQSNKLELKIVDSGEGIAPNNIGKLFEPFFTTKEVGEGTGLGLSITKGILDEHDASIILENSPSTCFTIVFSQCQVETHAT